MIEHLHDHIVEELKLNTRTDTIFVIVSIALNLIYLAVNSAIASERSVNIPVMLMFVVLIIVVSIVAEIGLIKGKKIRAKLTKGLLEIYKDNKIDKYYDEELISSHSARYNLFIIAVLSTALVSIIVPFLTLVM